MLSDSFSSPGCRACWSLCRPWSHSSLHPAYIEIQCLGQVTKLVVSVPRGTKEEIKQTIEKDYYRLDFTLDKIRPNYFFDETCQGSVPQAIQAFLESTSFEDAIRNAISIDGDSDTIAAITGAIAGAFLECRQKLGKVHTGIWTHPSKRSSTEMKIIRNYSEPPLKSCKFYSENEYLCIKTGNMHKY